ncbi:hypothetical protein DFJ73DRAFT_775833 [Zopfochytrium polystomum]|nr:hypothetical protein DFJ73DRAFT_775831 [Zopfochytrium polystomum]KAI9354284.1 hypothetical protein DFJ73DRAFT_775833 [Zopfochytrium polystomum]
MLPFCCLLALLGALLVLTLAPSSATALPKNDRFVYHSLPTADARAKELNRQSGRHGVVMIDTTKVPNYKDRVDLRQYVKNKDKFTGAMENNVMKEMRS